MSRLLLCHRRAEGVSCAQFARHFRGERRALVRRHSRALDHSEYRQLYQTSTLNPLYQGIKLTRDPTLLALLPRTDNGPKLAPNGGSNGGGSNGSGSNGGGSNGGGSNGGASGRSANPRALERGPSRGASAGWDMVELFEFDNLNAMQALISPAGKTAAAELALDQQRWASSSSVMIADSIVGTTFERAPSTAVSTLFFLRAAPPLSRREMLDYWASRHKQLFLSKQSALGYGAYTQLHVRDEPSLHGVPELWGGNDEAPFDGVACVSYAGACRVALDFVSPRALLANLQLVCDEVTFIDSRRSVLVFGADERVS